MTTLHNLYVRAPNEIFARHLLATACQTLDDFLQTLLKLSDCNFTAVSAEQYKEEMIHDS